MIKLLTTIFIGLASIFGIHLTGISFGSINVTVPQSPAQGYTLSGLSTGNWQATSTLFISPRGNVGIGTTGPVAKLDFGTSAANNKIVIGTYTNGNGWTGIGMDSGSAGIRVAGGYSSTADPLMDVGYYSYDTNHTWTSRMWVQNNGNVGIGTTSPLNLLSLYSATSATAGFSGGSAMGQWTMGYDVTNNRFAFASSSDIATNVKMVISNNGNVGIGTTSPQRTLVVNGQSAVSGSSGSFDLYRRDTGVLSWGMYSPAGDLRFYKYDGAGDLVTIDTNGNVGIGTTNPQVSLDILGTGAIGTRYGRTVANNTSLTEVFDSPTVSNSNYLLMGVDTTGGSVGYASGGVFLSTGANGSGTARDLIIHNYGAKNVIIATNNTEKVRVQSDGNVGIATTSPVAKLNVNGDVKFEGASYVTTSSLGGGALLAGACASVTTTITTLGNYASTTAFATTPQSDIGDGYFYDTIAVTATTVKTRVCAAVAGTPTASIYNIKIIK